jgi:hypothetical protein
MRDPAKGLTPMARLGYGVRERQLTLAVEMRPGAFTLAKALRFNSVLPGDLSEIAILTATAVCEGT